MNALIPMDEMERMAKAVVESGLFGAKTLQEAISLMLLACAENVHPMIAMRDYHIVEGKPALKADAMLARFQAGGGIVEWEEYTDTKVSARFSHPGSPKPVLIEWTIEAATKVSVWSKKKGGWEPLTNKHTWKSYPRQMLKARVISEGVRATNPGVAVGIYTVEETQDFTEPRQEKNITPSAGVEDQLTEAELQYVADVAVKMKAYDNIGDMVYEMENAGLNAEQQIYLWTHFDSRQRSAMKKEQARMKRIAAPQEVSRGEAVAEHAQNDRPVAASGTRVSTVGTASENSLVTEITAPVGAASKRIAAPVATQTFPPVAPAVKGLGLPNAPDTRPSDLSGQQGAASEVISPAAHKRLEARISELKLDREAVKKYVKDTFGRDHFTEMTKDEYDKLDKMIEMRALKIAKAAQTATEEDGGP